MEQSKKIAQAFHETNERLAPEFSYERREASRVPWGYTMLFDMARRERRAVGLMTASFAAVCVIWITS